MSITPGFPDPTARETVRTWVTSQWKLAASRVSSQRKSTYALRVDRDGCGYQTCYSTTGPLGFNGGLTTEHTPFTLEHGEVLPMSLLSNFPTPAFQSASAPNPNFYEGKGRLVGEDFGAGAAKGAGWSPTFAGSAAEDPTVVAHNTVTDPAGNPTASTISFPSLPSGGYSFIACQTDIGLGSNTTEAGYHNLSFWARGHAGGEVLLAQVTNSGYANDGAVTSITLTTSWQRFTVEGSITAASANPQEWIIGTATAGTPMTVDFAFPNAQ